MKSLQKEGLGFNPKKADVVSTAAEEQLWVTGALGKDTPEKLLRSLVYLLGVNLALRTGEHRKLRREMFQVSLVCILLFSKFLKGMFFILAGP